MRFDWGDEDSRGVIAKIVKCDIVRPQKRSNLPSISFEVRFGRVFALGLALDEDICASRIRAKVSNFPPNASETKDIALSFSVLSAGDYSMGTPFGAATRETGGELQLMSLMGYDAVTFGNH